jgi:leucyl/phenylalanyl-tRNA---protein transferase
MLIPHILSATAPDFPDPRLALTDPNGLLAIGGDLSPTRLITAYRAGIFPWFGEGEPILWWSPDPRAILYPADIKISRSLRQIMRKLNYQVRWDSAFEAVIAHCAKPRATQDGTWITQDMIDAYTLLHEQGIAHSVEIWQEEHLVGGLYGVQIDKVFCGESMFSLIPNASKIALAHLARGLAERQHHFIDCQLPTEHLTRMGAITIPRDLFLHKLKQALADNT